jgi:hypothetical protein
MLIPPKEDQRAKIDEKWNDAAKIFVKTRYFEPENMWLAKDSCIHYIDP